MKSEDGILAEWQSQLKKQAQLLPSVYVDVRKPARYDNSLNEKVIEIDSSAHIVLGGNPQNVPEIAKARFNGNITLVAGLGTAIKNNPVPLSVSGALPFSSKFYYDSAVIQISEQTNVDSNFGARIRDRNAENASAVALKADEIRLFSRGSVKIITGIDQRDKHISDKDAPSHPKRDYSGIHLIANNSVDTETQLQPLVLGRNLQEFLNEVLNEISNLHNIIQKVAELQYMSNEALLQHTHLDPFFQSPLPIYTDPNLNSNIAICNTELEKITVIDANTKTIPNIENLRKNYLTKNPNKYINSYFNKTN